MLATLLAPEPIPPIACTINEILRNLTGSSIVVMYANPSCYIVKKNMPASIVFSRPK
jgi:hypothetical protein